jgi:hypothetical protein
MGILGFHHIGLSLGLSFSSISTRRPKQFSNGFRSGGSGSSWKETKETQETALKEKMTACHWTTVDALCNYGPATLPETAWKICLQEGISHFRQPAIPDKSAWRVLLVLVSGHEHDDTKTSGRRQLSWIINAFLAAASLVLHMWLCDCR